MAQMWTNHRASDHTLQKAAGQRDSNVFIPLSLLPSSSLGAYLVGRRRLPVNIISHPTKKSITYSETEDFPGTLAYLSVSAFQKSRANKENESKERILRVPIIRRGCRDLGPLPKQRQERVLDQCNGPLHLSSSLWLSDNVCCCLTEISQPRFTKPNDTHD